MRGVLYTRYPDLEHTWVITNGDGAEWIRAGIGHFRLALYQYDRLHLYRDLLRVLRGQPGRFEAARAVLERDDVAQFLIEVVEAEGAAATPEERAEIGQMRELLVSLGEALRDYRERLKERGMAVDPTWRGLGKGGRAGLCGRHSRALPVGLPGERGLRAILPGPATVAASMVTDRGSRYYWNG